jgi:hypothetical protein
MGVGGGAGGRFSDSVIGLSEVFGRWAVEMGEVEVDVGEVGEEGEES